MIKNKSKSKTHFSQFYIIKNKYELRENVPLFAFFFPLFLFWLPSGTWSPGPGITLSYSCGNARFLTHCAWPGVEPTSQCSQEAASPIAPHRNSCLCLFLWWLIQSFHGCVLSFKNCGLMSGISRFKQQLSNGLDSGLLAFFLALKWNLKPYLW